MKQAHTAAELPRVQSRRSKLLTFEVFAVDRLAYKFERNRVPGQTTAKWFLYAWAADRILAKCGSASADYCVGIGQC